MRIGSVSGIAGRGDSSLIRPVPDAETLPSSKLYGFVVKLSPPMTKPDISDETVLVKCLFL